MNESNFKNLENRVTLRSDNITRYLNEIKKYSLLTPDEEHKLAVESSHGDMKARELLINSNLRFAVSVAKLYCGNNEHLFEELINEANLGLVEAAENFDPSMGFKFISHAVWYVKKNIFRYFHESSRLIRLPLNKHQVLSKLRKIEGNLTQEIGRLPTFEELFEELNRISKTKLKEDSIKLAVRSNDKSINLERRGTEDEEDHFPIELINGDYNDNDSKEYTEHVLFFINQELNRFPKRNSEIFKMRFGMDGYREMTLQEIAEKFDLTRECIRLIIKSMIRKLNRRLKKILK